MSNLVIKKESIGFYSILSFFCAWCLVFSARCDQRLFESHTVNKRVFFGSRRLNLIGREFIVGIPHRDAGKNALGFGNARMLAHNGSLHHALTVNNRAEAALPCSETYRLR